MTEIKTVKSSVGDITQRKANDPTDKLEAAEQKIGKQKKSFFQLLAVQLQNQDPTAPMDTNEMSAQIFTLNALEQQLETNKYLQGIFDLLQGQRMSESSGYIGKAALYEGNQFNLSDGLAEMSYTLDDKAEEVLIDIINPEGKTVYSGVLENEPGEHKFNWEGKDIHGNPLSEGNYKFKISAKNSEGKSVEVHSFVTGKIDGIVTENNDYKFSINGNEVKRDLVKSIKATESFETKIADEIERRLASA
jgi:flagellar basal-body rod modification protein FlgD